MVKKVEAKPVEVMHLEAFIAMHEVESQKTGLVVTKIVHPEGVERIYPGRFAGIPIEQGELSSTYSDGSKH